MQVRYLSPPSWLAPTCCTASGCGAGAATPRQQLRTAHDLFDAQGFEAFAQRSRGELLATGERAGKRTGQATEQFTPQEMQVTRLVVAGSSNRQVAAQLFLSPNTVEYHLQKVFRKVGVSSRTQLAHALLGQPAGTGRFRSVVADAPADPADFLVGTGVSAQRDR
jgi:DNA-binding CsgD family transcriptional regulator